MTTQNTCSIVVALLIMLVASGTALELMPAPPETVAKCKKSMGLHCGNRINVYLFGRGTPFPNSCCAELMHLGKKCHDAVVTKHLIGKPQGYVVKIFKKSDWTWDHCVRVVEFWKRRGHH